MRRRYVLAVAVMLVTTGCPEPTAIWLAPGASVERAVFVLGREQGYPHAIYPTLLRVDRCPALQTGRYPPAEEASWFLTRTEGAGPLSQIVYGVAPPGYEEARAAVPLEPDECYEVVISGTGSLRFVSDEGGRLVAEPS